VKTGSEYHLTDSLLKSDHVYLVNNPGELKEVNFSKFSKVLVFNGGHSSKPLIDTLTKKHRLITRLNFKDSYQIAVLMPGKKP
jgi:CRISPR/Cas system-associated endonuclease Cas1